MNAGKILVMQMALLFALLAAPAQAGEDGPILLRNVQILHLEDSEPEVQPGMSILMEDGVISRIVAGPADDASTSASVIDGGGRIVMAGLTDMHVHVWDEASLGAYLAAGVTTIRNMSGMPFHLRLADQIDSGTLIGPRLLTTGPILNSPGPNAQINHQLVTTAAQARDAVRQQYEAGYRRLKVYSNLNRDAYEAIREEARRLGMTITGHTPEGVRDPGIPRDQPFRIGFDELLDDGFDTIEHVESIVWHGLRDCRDERAARELARRIAAAGVPVDPTLLSFHNLLRVAETGGDYLHRSGTENLNPLLVALSQAEYERWSSEDAARNRSAYEFYERVTRILFEEGVLLVAGTDSGIFTNLPGVSLIEELELLNAAGLAPADVLRAATINPARVLGEEARSGRIAEGYRADLLLLDDNPLHDLTTMRSISALVTGGRFFDREALARMRESASRHDIERTRRNLVAGLEAQGIDPVQAGL